MRVSSKAKDSDIYINNVVLMYRLARSYLQAGRRTLWPNKEVDLAFQGIGGRDWGCIVSELQKPL